LHFTREVPRRALRNPMLLNAVLALASRHHASMTGQNEEAASLHHSQCITEVIAALSDSRGYDEELLVTIVLLRVYEELGAEEADGLLHLQGAARLLDTIPMLLQQGGLAAAAAWQALRQDIYVAIYKERGPSLDLANYMQPGIRAFEDEDSCANAIVLIFARALQLKHSNQAVARNWDDAMVELTDWDQRRIQLFGERYIQNTDTDHLTVFPAIPLMNTMQGVSKPGRRISFFRFKPNTLRQSLLCSTVMQAESSCSPSSSLAITRATSTLLLSKALWRSVI
jgi:hypothetical protein